LFKEFTDLLDLRVAGDRVFIDIKDQLFQRIALREKDFRAFITAQDWSIFIHRKENMKSLTGQNQEWKP